MAGFFDTPIEYLKGVGPQRAALLNKELNIFSFGDLIQHYPFRHEDRSRFYRIAELNDELPYVQVRGKVVTKELIGTGFKKRLVVIFSDGEATMELVWFKGINWIAEKMKPGAEFNVFRKPNRFGSKISIAHPDLDPVTVANERGGQLVPVYPLTEKLRAKHIESKTLGKLIQDLLLQAKEKIS